MDTIEAKTGESFFYEFSHLDTVCMEKYSDDLHIIKLDNGLSKSKFKYVNSWENNFLMSPSLLSRIKPYGKTMVRNKNKIKIGNIWYI